MYRKYTRAHFLPKFKIFEKFLSNIYIYEKLLQWKIEDHLEGER